MLPHLSPTYQVALAAHQTGLSVLPIKADGSKQPALGRWKIYQERQPSLQEIAAWFRLPHVPVGLALVTGKVSGGLEALDFDDPAIYTAWLKYVRHDRTLASLYHLIATGYEELTPGGGRHLLYCCAQIEGSQKLAARPVERPQRVKTLIETRGEGGLIIIDPSGGTVHPSGKPYRRIRGSVRTIRRITPAQRALLLESARQLDEMPPPPLRSTSRPSSKHAGARPGDLFNAQAQWADVLGKHGWVLVGQFNQEQFWRRPGKAEGISATVNYNQNNRLLVFSTSTPFQIQKCYSLFEAYACLEHGNDFSAAARALAAQGYVEKQTNP
jgi:bifunctional DNA primase/polymerase-like protein